MRHTAADKTGHASTPATHRQFKKSGWKPIPRLEAHTATDMGIDPFPASGDDLIGTSRPMRELSALLGKIAPHSMPVLVTGETGTGKELVARALHRRGPRHGHPFVVVSCSALGGGLLESELFGHVRGAFTGLTDARAGLFERAHGGTLLLDDVGELPLAAQGRLVRVLETGHVVRLGSNDSIAVDVRVIATTHRSLDCEIVENRFRADLYYRLSAFRIQVPPLRERRTDIPLLIDHLLLRISRSLKQSICGVTPDACRRLMEWDWQGNVRELHNVLARAALVAPTDVIDEHDLPAEIAGAGIGSVTPIAELERAEVVRAMAETHGNKMEAARRLGISRRALYRRLEKFGVAPKVSEAA
jgi:DNA-binding NtrC family response regulator